MTGRLSRCSVVVLLSHKILPTPASVLGSQLILDFPPPLAHEVKLQEGLRVFCCPLQEATSFCILTPLLPLQDINKRLSLPADIRLPDGYLEKFNLIGPALFEQPISRRLRRVSLVRLPLNLASQFPYNLMTR